LSLTPNQPQLGFVILNPDIRLGQQIELLPLALTGDAHHEIKPKASHFHWIEMTIIHEISIFIA